MSDVKDPTLLEIPGAEGKSIDFLTNLLRQGAPLQETPGAMQVPLQQVAGMTGAEQTVQSLLGKFLGTPATEGEAYKLGMGELSKTLGGETYDPRTSDFWKGFREQSEMEQEKGIAGIRRRGQLGGGLFATPGGRIEAEDVRRRGAERSMMLGGLYEKERERKVGATQQALGYAGFGEQGALSRLQAGTAIGAIPRQIKDVQYQAAYQQKMGQAQEGKFTAQQKVENKYAQQMFPYTAQAGVAQQLMPQWLMSGETEFDFPKIRSSISQMKSIMNK